jgi:hypothetical protein
MAPGGGYSSGEKFSGTADTGFPLKKAGYAQIKTVVIDPATGATAGNTALADLV